MKIWVEKEGHEYYLTTQDNYWDDPVEVTEEWWEEYTAVSGRHWDMQLEAAKKAGYEA